jgi:spoIIIJ-associated protein
MKEVFKQSQDFLNQVFTNVRLDLRATAAETEGGCVLNIDGTDAPLLRSEGGELLDALEHLVNQSFARDLSKGERLVCDVEDFRAVRETELRAMAHHAAERVRSSGVQFTFGPMNANERRIIHMELVNEEQLHTESIGEGSERRLRVSLKTPSSNK